MAKRSRYTPVYEAFDRFLKTCILGDRSLLWPTEKAWTDENVAQVKQWVVDTPMEGSGSFQEKLLEQMRYAGPQHWMLIGDVFFVYLLPSSVIKFDSKRNYIRWVANQGGLPEPSYKDELWEAQKAGFTKTSQQYHSKYGQFWLLLLLANRIKGHHDDEEILADPHRLEQTVDALLGGLKKMDRAYDMRHAILYMVFPDDYERIISTGDKRKIVKFYGASLEINAPGDQDDLGGLDEAVRNVRQALATQHDGDDPFDFYDDRNWEWRGGTPVVMPKSSVNGAGESATPTEATLLLSTLARTRNVILHGPPGTGKTYVAKKAAEALVRPQAETEPSETALIMEAVEGLRFYEILALSMHRLGSRSSHTVSSIRDHPILQVRYQVTPVQNRNATIWGSLQAHVDPDSPTVNTAKRSLPYLFDKEEDGGRWFLTAAGREYVEQELGERLAKLEGGNQATAAADKFVEWTTFHQSYAYEDFVEGLRPVQSEDDPEGISYAVLPGVFRRICTRAAADPQNKYVLVIDEINRGNISKILGELMTLLEDDKRAGEPNELAVTLPYSGDAFSVPNNLYIIGTMNTADRSIALLDVALRRRFAFVEVMPDPALLMDAGVEYEGTVVPLGDLLRTLNRGIARSIGRDHQIGHSYLLNVAKADGEDRLATLEFVWNNQILPLLEEYFYAQQEKLAQLLAPFRADEESDGESASRDDAEFELGRETGDRLVFALRELVSRGDAL